VLQVFQTCNHGWGPCDNRLMDLLTLYGFVAVASMLLFYALESRAAVFVLAFALACAASSAYGFLQGAWPFGFVEGVWTLVALKRWRVRLAEERKAG